MHPEPTSSDRSSPVVAVAATFTAEPIAPALDFWLRALWPGGRVAFAPFDQVFQQILDPASALRRAGAGVVLVRMIDWQDRGRARTWPPLPERTGLERHRLPNGLEVYHLNRYETDYVYREIFVDRAYVKHGITIAPGDTVVDIGANIGLFTAFVQAHAPGARVIAFEPSPAAYAALSANVARYGGVVTALPYGAGDRDATAAFTAYARSSVFSSFHADAAEDRAAIRAVIANVVRAEARANDADAEALTDTLVASRLDAEVVDVPVRRLSTVLANLAVERIDLLKVDAEKSELAVLAGLTPADWARVRQVVIEVHDATGDRTREVRDVLERQGFAVTADEESLLTGSGLVNLYATRPGAVGVGPAGADRANALPEPAAEFVRVLRDTAPDLTAPLTVMICPSPVVADPAGEDAIERDFVAALQDLPSVTVVPSTDWCTRYPVDDLHDVHGDAMGRVPYTADGFAALGTAIARCVWSATTPRAKVLVVDADQTLWDGVVGEDGVRGVSFGPGRLALHGFLLAQRATGVLLAISSKNDPADVLAVLGERPESLLRPEHLSAHAIGWGPKSAGLCAIAAELNVGLDSLVFLDDNPAECAEVSARCPGVVAWCLPAADRDLPAFLDHLWPLDERRITDDDRKRADRYAEERARKTFQQSAASYAAFIAGLQLDVDCRPCDPGSLARAAQLFERTNQFNVTTIRRGETDLRRAIDAGLDVRVVRVRDRFGDYGLVGVVAMAPDGPVLDVDSFLLSCRVLGKGVEHRLLAEVGALAAARGLERVRLTYRPSARNEPARRFAEAVGRGTRAADGSTVYEWTASEAAAITFVPGADTTPVEDDAPRPRALTANGLTSGQIETLSALPGRLRTAAAVRRAATRQRGDAAVAVPETPAQQRLAVIWADILQLDAVGIDDDFYACGGDSIRAVMIAARAQDAGVHVTLRDVLESGTIRRLAERATTGAHRADEGVAAPPAATEFEATPLQAMYYAQYVAGLDAGFEQFTLSLQGALDPDRFLRAWQRVVARHEALRSSFHDEQGRIVQRVHARALVTGSVGDWQGLSETRQAAMLSALQASDRALRFDLTEPPLLRLSVVRTKPAAWRVVCSFHHLVLDGWSWPIVARDLAQAYAAPDDALPPAPSFAAFANFVRRAPTAGAEAFWRQTLAGLPAAPPLAAGGRDGGAPASVARTLDAAATEALLAASRRHRTTPAALFAGAWALALADETGANDVVIGLAAGARPAELPGADAIVGTCVANLPLRLACPPELPVAEWLASVQRQLIESTSHQHLAPERLHALSGQPPGARLFESLLVVQNYAGAGDGALRLGEAADAPRIAAIDMPVRTGYPITVVARPGARLELSVIARGAAGGRDQAGALLEAWIGALTAIGRADRERLGALRQPRAARLPAAAAATPARRPAATATNGGANGVHFDTPLEQRIAAVWAEVFGHTQFGADDNFFDLGGHSLLMLAVQSRLTEALGRALSIVELFQYPTVRGLADRLAAAEGTADSAAGPQLGAVHARAARQRQALAHRRLAARP
jgi:FkbH-like protein/FkbM family methyltransferase